MKKFEIISTVIGGAQIIATLALATTGIIIEKKKRNGKPYQGMFSGKNIKETEA